MAKDLSKGLRGIGGDDKTDKTIYSLDVVYEAMLISQIFENVVQGESLPKKHPIESRCPNYLINSLRQSRTILR